MGKMVRLKNWDGYKVEETEKRPDNVNIIWFEWPRLVGKKRFWLIRIHRFWLNRKIGL